MNNYWITLAGFRVSVFEDTDIHSKTPYIAMSLPCLQGEDVRREAGKVSVRFHSASDPVWPAVTVDPGYGVEVSAGSDLRGWGELDGESVVLKPDECAWEVNVPKRLWDAAGAWAAGKFATPAPANA